MVVARACLSDDDVVAFVGGAMTPDEVARAEVHLDGCSACMQLVAGVARTTVPTRGRAPLPRETDDWVIDGQYRVVRELGRGGMGVVYLARDLRLDRDVAVKLGTLVSDASLARVEREAIALARLSHPNVVTVHQVGESGGRLYIAMEHVAGGNAREWLEAAPRSTAEILALYAAAGDGLVAAHAAGLVHRDFKPDNVLVGVDGRPRVADFGLVRSGATSGAEPVADAPAPELERMTQTGAVIGTPAYMAPEQLGGGAVDARADQFAYCVALWEALTGARPFAGRTRAELARAMRRAPALDADRARRIPRHVLAALRRGLASDRDARWPSMSALLAALRVDRSARRRRATVAIAVVLAAAVSAIAVVALPRALGGGGQAAATTPECAPLARDAREIFVDARAADRGTGTRACPFRTITQALGARGAGPTVVHVAAGTYDTAHGERFPFVLRGAVELAGAGADATHVIGTGRWDPRGSVVWGDALPVTMVAGDEHATIRISGLSMASGATSDNLGGYGVFCDRGDLGERSREASATSPPPPSLVLANLEIGPIYDAGVVAGGTDGGTGCSMRLDHVFIHHAYLGAWVLGCGAVPLKVWAPAAALDVENSHFLGIERPLDHGGQGISVWDCTRWVTVRDTEIGQGDDGLVVVNHDTPYTHVEIERTSFHDLRILGVGAGRAARIDRLVDNDFGNITGGPAAMIANRAVGVVIDGGNERDAYPQVALARGNSFNDNDVAVELRGQFPVTGVVDFGRVDDPGRNGIRCNATADGSNVAGHDLVIRTGIAPSARVTFAGDVWDHAPPSRGAANGADVDAPAKSPIDLRNARAATTSCSSRIPGP